MTLPEPCPPDGPAGPFDGGGWVGGGGGGRRADREASPCKRSCRQGELLGGLSTGII